MIYSGNGFCKYMQILLLEITQLFQHFCLKYFLLKEKALVVKNVILILKHVKKKSSILAEHSTLTHHKVMTKGPLMSV